MARITTSTRKEIPLRVHGLDFLTAGSASCIEETTPSSSPLGSTSDLAEPSWHTHRDKLDWDGAPAWLPRPVCDIRRLHARIDISTDRQLALAVSGEDDRKLSLALFDRKRGAVPGLLYFLRAFIGETAGADQNAKLPNTMRALFTWVQLRPYLLRKIVSSSMKDANVLEMAQWRRVLRRFTYDSEWATCAEALGLDLGSERSDGIAPSCLGASAAVVWRWPLPTHASASPFDWDTGRVPCDQDLDICLPQWFSNCGTLFDVVAAGEPQPRPENHRASVPGVNCGATADCWATYVCTLDLLSDDNVYIIVSTPSDRMVGLAAVLVEWWDYELGRKIFLPRETDALVVLGGERLLRRSTQWRDASGASVQPSRRVWPATHKDEAGETRWLSGCRRIRELSERRALEADTRARAANAAQCTPPTGRFYQSFSEFLEAQRGKATFEGHVLPSYMNGASTWLSDTWTAFLLYDIGELDFRHALLFLDLRVRLSHPQIAPLYEDDAVTRFKKVLSCWGTGGLSPDYREHNWLASPDAGDRLKGLRNFAALMRSWPRTEDMLPSMAELDELEPRSIDCANLRSAERRIWATYMQMHWDYTRSTPLLPFIRPELPPELDTQDV
ncbi:hypothetical protein AURDEDRAFT_178433 [Auricularia subglabra TFB-10046 SS5]|uniref:Uncharacterized protein n=1 Tax=Auricularia subglabra (strain TFB-10046 / SS5) TaxID=717982 RepID=J0WL60_AURST|nr:hypothetical protein AURDEDRAFT_178433 [Auricularia subglabra TFB-10046 SS5]